MSHIKLILFVELMAMLIVFIFWVAKFFIPSLDEAWVPALWWIMPLIVLFASLLAFPFAWLADKFL